ncbi:MAG: hypothetical protein U1F68_18730 [Gammaproteobacteria bacterium]
MRSKGKPKTTTTVKRDPNTLIAEAKPNEEQAASLARVILQPSVKGAVTIKEYSNKYGDIELMRLVRELAEQVRAANDGDLKLAEGMLMVQAHTLDAIFNSLAQRSINAEYMENLDRYLRLALKAQNQCRATLETLAAIKSPASVAFVRQANIGYNQQINNDAGRENNPSRAGENPNPQNKLLEAKPYERLDTGTPGATVGVDSALETVGEIDRAANARAVPELM